MVHSFYAGMGGFVFDIDNADFQLGAPLFDGPSRLTLTARGVALLANCGLLPDIRKSDILDRSKIDALAKFLACLQAGWMVVQIVSRVSFHLPISLLEVNTMADVFCAFIIYILWLYKPKWVNEPTRLEGPWVRSVAAYMYMSSHISGWNARKSGLLDEFVVESELSALAYFLEKESPISTTSEAETVLRPGFELAESKQGSHLAGSKQKPNDLIEPQGHFAPKSAILHKKNMDSLELGISSHVEASGSLQVERWKLAAEAVQSFPAIRERFTDRFKSMSKKDADALRLYPEMPLQFLSAEKLKATKSADWLECPPEQLVTECAANWPADDLLRGVAGLMVGVVLWFASMAFGGVHAAAWYLYFPTGAEAWLWRSSSFYISLCGLIWLAVNMLAQCSKRIWWYWYNALSHQVHWLNYVLWGITFLACGSAYLFARIFLVVEAFISLRALAAAAYDTPNWTFSIPHF
ncbi:hypothetical protein MMC20_004616 [Loxospora ochrophaea]|nr:hypothetical protein [Loxospora ochrophaea]